jgi:peptidylprolyl isomerase
MTRSAHSNRTGRLARELLGAACALSLLMQFAGASLAAQPAAKPYRSAAEIIDAAPADHWRKADPANLLYMQLAAGVVIIELAPDFAPEHVANIRTLAREHFWDGTSVYRVQDNFVAQFGDPESDDEEKARSLGTAKRKLPAEFHRDMAGLRFDRLPDVDGWAPEVGFVDGFAAARAPRTSTAWLAHCYGTVGAGRGNDPASSLGAELYVVIGQSPRHLDDNITVVGRVLMGIELLSALPRGPSPMGMYDNAAQRAPIRAIRLGSEVPENVRPKVEVLRTDSSTFRDAVEARRNRVDDFYKRPAGHIDLCNVTVPMRVAP